MAARWRGRTRVAAILVLLLGTPSIVSAGSPSPEAEGRSICRASYPGGVRLSYEWKDAAGTTRKIALPVPDLELRATELAFGFTLEELRTFLVQAEVKIREEEGLSALDIARKVVSRISDPEWCRVTQDPASDFAVVMRTDHAGRPGAQAEIERILEAYRRRWEASRKTVCDRLDRRLKDFAAARGMDVTSRGIAVDYKKLVQASAERLKPVADEFRRICGSSKARLLEAVYSFVESIPYRPQPPVEGGRYTAGVSVPLRVLIDDQGDCDSKAVLFAALWLNLSGHRTILVRVPEHMLVGVTFPTLRGGTLKVQGRSYLLLEMNCPGRSRPGLVSRYAADAIDAGNYKYLIVS